MPLKVLRRGNGADAVVMALEHNQKLIQNMQRSSNLLRLAIFIFQHNVGKAVRVVAPDFLDIA